MSTLREQLQMYMTILFKDFPPNEHTSKLKRDIECCLINCMAKDIFFPVRLMNIITGNVSTVEPQPNEIVDAYMAYRLAVIV